MRSAPRAAAENDRAKRSQWSPAFHPFIRRCAFARSGAQRAETKNPRIADFLRLPKRGRVRRRQNEPNELRRPLVLRTSRRRERICQNEPNAAPMRCKGWPVMD
jgi:hypothetical protein